MTPPSRTTSLRPHRGPHSATLDALAARGIAALAADPAYRTAALRRCAERITTETCRAEALGAIGRREESL